MEVNECNIEIIFKIKIQINRSEFSKILNACTQTVTGCVFSKLHWIPNLKVMTGNYMIKKKHKKKEWWSLFFLNSMIKSRFE